MSNAWCRECGAELTERGEYIDGACFRCSDGEDPGDDSPAPDEVDDGHYDFEEYDEEEFYA